MAATRRRYTKAERAQTVAAAMVGTVEATAESTGIPRSTIDYWMAMPEFVELRQKTRDQVGEQMWAGIQIGLREVVKGLEGDAPLRDKATALGILYDKHALLTGGATARSENRDISGTLSDAELVAAIREADTLASGDGAPQEVAESA